MGIFQGLICNEVLQKVSDPRNVRRTEENTDLEVLKKTLDLPQAWFVNG